ncbi:hypothetical protein RYX36_026789 [Vicia faba]
MQADPTAIDVVHLKMIILLDMEVTWPVLEDMVLIAVLHRDGKVETGFAQELAVECIITLAGQNATNAKCQGIMVVLTESKRVSEDLQYHLHPSASFSIKRHHI